MEPGTTLIGVIIIIICCIPFILLGIKNKKQKKLILQSLEDFAAQKSCKISKYDIWKESCIGIDESGKNVFAIRNTKNFKKTYHFNLLDVKKCKVENYTRKQDEDLVVENIKLHFEARDLTKKIDSFEFFNNNSDNAQISDEIQLAEKWSNLINEKIHSIKSK
jgi:hypothetical protein